MSVGDILKSKNIVRAQKQRLTKFRKNTDGNTSLMFAGSLSVLLLTITAAVDITSTLSTKSKMQDALDTAVLTAAVHAEESNFVEFGEKAFAVNLADNNLKNTRLTFEKRQNGDSSELIGVVKSSSPLIFSNFTDKTGYDISVRSVVKMNTTEVSAPSDAAPTCIAALDKKANPGMTINSGATIDASGCEIHVHSETNSAMSVNAGINIDVVKTCVAGPKITDNSNGQIGDLELNCGVTPDPFLDKIPEPSDVSCDYNWGNYDNAPGNQITMEPGVYCGWHNFNNSNIAINFEPGLYVIKNGGWNVNGGNWSGQGVTFYMYDTSNLNFNSNVNASFTAPSSGDYEGIFLTEKPGLPTRSYNLNSNSNFNFEGAVYLPSKRLTVNSGGNLVVRKTQIVANTIMLNGTMGIDSSAIPSTDVTTQESVKTPYLAE